MQTARTEPERREPETGCRRAPRLWSHLVRWRYAVPVVYLVVALPLEVFLCFFVPPMQSADEGRHFFRSCQFAQGQILPEIDSAAHTAGGMLPAAVVDFVREKMNPEFYRNEDRLPTIGARLRALNAAAQHQAPLSEKEFGVFPGSAVYPPALYLPQTAGIRLARFFTNKAYIWFYAARISNAIVAVLLIFFALLLAPAYKFVLLIPAILPMSLYQIASGSSDAGFISVSILLVALCLRFVRSDGRLLRAGIIVCLLLLTLGKPVYLPFALLLLPAYKRLGWRRVLTFSIAAVVISAAAYLAWAAYVRPVFAMAGNDFPGHNPSAQVHFILTDPFGFLAVLLRSAKWDTLHTVTGLIGFFGWVALPLPKWFYEIAYAFLAAIALLFFFNWKKADRGRFLWGVAAAICIVGAIVLAAFIMWTPVDSSRVVLLQGRYLLPTLAALTFCAPSFYLLTTRSRMTISILVLAFFCLSVITTVRTLKHYYFPESKFLGKNVHAIFAMTPRAACSAAVGESYSYWFSTIVSGTAKAPGEFRVVLADKNGTIWGESDPVLAGREFPFDLLRRSSNWRVHFWTLNRNITLYYWLIRGNTACKFGSGLKLKPQQIPSA